MTRQLIIGLAAEGTTDYRFLSNIIRRTYEELAFECQGDVEIPEIQEIHIRKTAIIDYFVEAARASLIQLNYLRS
ncbi:MAG: hypothetical protein AAGN35_02810 [Bacteroidota bacterium]